MAIGPTDRFDGIKQAAAGGIDVEPLGGIELKPSGFEKFAICKAAVNKNNTITIGKDNRAGSDMTLGDEVKVRLIKIQTDNFVRPRDTANFTTTIQKTGQITIPNDAMRDLRLEPGEVIGYVAVKTSSIPGVNNGPVRDAVKGETPVGKRKRESNRESFTGGMFVTGQVTIPQKVREPMNIKQGDTVTVTVNGQETYTKEIGTGNRISITKAERDELGIDADEKPDVDITVAVF